MNEDNVELYNISPFKEDGRWYLKLIYKYEDGIGKHTVVIPKAASPQIIPNIVQPNAPPRFTRQYGVYVPAIKR